jgi:hypothetical protein
MNKPTSLCRGKESSADRQCFDLYILHMPVVDKAGEEDDGKGCAVVFNEFSNMPLKKVTLSYDGATIGEAQNKQSDGNREKS